MNANELKSGRLGATGGASLPTEGAAEPVRQVETRAAEAAPSTTQVIEQYDEADALLAASRERARVGGVQGPVALATPIEPPPKPIEPRDVEVVATPVQKDAGPWKPAAFTWKEDSAHPPVTMALHVALARLASNPGWMAYHPTFGGIVLAELRSTFSSGVLATVTPMQVTRTSTGTRLVPLGLTFLSKEAREQGWIVVQPEWETFGAGITSAAAMSRIGGDPLAGEAFLGHADNALIDTGSSRRGNAVPSAQIGTIVELAAALQEQVKKLGVP